MKKITCLILAFIAAFVVSCGSDGNKEGTTPECVTADDCGEGRECQEGFCVDKEPEKKPECVTSEDCTDGKECKDGSCVTVPMKHPGGKLLSGAFLFLTPAYVRFCQRIIGCLFPFVIVS